MYKLVRFEATQVIGFVSGQSKKKFVLDLRKFKDRKILLVVGANATGKSTFLSLIHPLHTPSDGRSKFIVPGKEGSLIRTYEGSDGTILISRCVYVPKEDTHLAKCYLAIQKPGETEATELNPNGNVTSYTSLLMTYFGITKDYVNFASYNDAVEGIVNMTDGERKANVSSLIPNTGRFELAYNTINDKYKELRNLMRNVAQKIMNIRDADSLESDLRRITKELNRATEEREEVIRKLAKAEGRVKELSHGDDVNGLVRNYQRMLTDLANFDSTLSTIKNQLEDFYDRLNITPDESGIFFKGYETEIDRMISKYERKVASADASISNAMTLREKALKEISSTEKEIAETESVLFSIQTQDIKELEKTKKGYLEQIESLRYTKMKDAYANMSYEECVALYRTVTTMTQMIQALFDNFDNLVSEFFATGCQNNSNAYISSLDHLQVQIESKSSRKDALYREIIEKEQYMKFQDILDQRPATCHDDTCPFIANALKWSHISGEIAELRTAYNEICIDIQNDQKQADTFEQSLQLREQAQNLISMIQQNAEPLKKYLHITEAEIYTAIGNGSWNTVLDLMKLKQIAAILSEKSLYTRIVDQLLPDIDHAIEIARVYGTNKAMLTSQIERMESTLELLNEEKDAQDMAYDTTSKMKHIYATKLLLWRRVDELVAQYKDISKDKMIESELAKKQEEEINKIAELVEKCKELDSELVKLDDIIHDLTPAKQQIEIELAELLRLKAEKDQIDQDFLIVDVMRSIIQPGKGIRKELLNIYFYDIYEIANQLLLNTFDGKLRLHEFIITDKEFTIPFEYAGEIGTDVSLASSSQKATIATAISLAIISKLIDRYSIVTFDESDQTLSPANKAVFVDILSKQMNAIGIDQAFLITHSPNFYSSISGTGFIGFPGYENEINESDEDVIVV